MRAQRRRHEHTTGSTLTPGDSDGEEADVQYWYNIRTGQVESDEDRSQNDDVMGPYDSREEAAGALATAHANTERWDDEDREWEERGASSGGSWSAPDDDSEGED